MNAETQEQNLKAFEALVEAHGARPAAWPETARGWAQALLDASPEARALLARAAELDTALDALSVAPPPPDLAARILASAPAFAIPAAPAQPLTRAPVRPAGPGLLERLAGWLTAGPALLPGVRPAPAMALAAVAGLVVGWAGYSGQRVDSFGEEDLLEIALMSDGLADYEPGDLE